MHKGLMSGSVLGKNLMSCVPCKTAQLEKKEMQKVGMEEIKVDGR